MSEFEDFDIGQWLRKGLFVNAVTRVRSFTRKRRSGTTSACIAFSLIAAVSTLAYSASASASQVQKLWADSRLANTGVPPDLALVPGRPEVFWSALTSKIATWQDVEESQAVDVPPLL